MSEYQVYAKLQKARMKLQAAPIKKSGHNKFAGYQYFELGDFLPTINEIFNELGLCSVISFDKELATLRIIDTDNGGSITFTSPMAEANLKGCYPIQNLGAVETYSRRYLYVTALEIVEHDALDATTGSEAPKSVKPISKDVFDSMDIEDQEAIRSIGVHVISLLAMDDVEGAVQYIEQCELDADSKTALWSLLDSKQRAAIKKFTTR
jgi:ERF superfamily